MFIGYATCANDVKRANEGWNIVQYSFVMQLMQMRWIHAVERSVKCQITIATKLFTPITDHGMHG